MTVYCYPASSNSKYVPMLFTGTQDRYRPIYRQQGTLTDAIADLTAGRRPIVHVHWEEFALDACATDAEADAAADIFVRDLQQVHDLAGDLFWTVHNHVPHEIPFIRQFLTIRTALARLADVVLVHNRASIETLALQVALDPTKVHVLEHPCYLDLYEDGATLEAGLDTVPEPRIQGFGWIRLQKRFGDMIEMMPQSFLAQRKLSIRISGTGPEADEVIARHATRDDIDWDVRHVLDGEVPHLLRSAQCVVLPYGNVFSSGVVLLAMSVGALIVAADTPHMREQLPPTGHRLLYPDHDPAAFRDVIDTVVTLSVGERRLILESNLAAARAVHPRIISLRLAGLYEQARARHTR